MGKGINARIVGVLIFSFIVAALTAGAVLLAAPGQQAYAADPGNGTRMVNVLQTITDTGKHNYNKITGVHSLKSPKKSQTFSSSQTIGGNTMPAGTYLVVAVNPQASSLASGNRPTVAPESGDATRGDIMVQYSKTSPPAGSTSSSGTIYGLSYGTDWFYNPDTGTAYIKVTSDVSMDKGYITVYDYLAENQTTKYIGQDLYAYETINGTPMPLDPSTAGGATHNPASISYNGLSYTYQRENRWQVPFYPASKLGYANNITVYGVALNGTTVTDAWQLYDGIDYYVSSSGKITFDEDLCISNILVKNDATYDESQISIVVEQRGTNSITLGALPSGYQYRILDSKGNPMSISTWTTNNYFSGLASGTKYVFQLRNTATGKIVSKRTIATTQSGSSGEPYKSPFQGKVGTHYTVPCHVDGHYDVPDSSEPSGICTTFYVTFHYDPGEDASDDEKELAKLVDGNQFAFHCVVPFAWYADGMDIDADIEVTEVTKDGYVNFWVYGDASPNQSWAGPLSTKEALPMNIHLYKKFANANISTGSNEAYSLEGAMFKVTGNGQTYDLGPTDASGYAELNDLKPGTYQIEEVVTPKGYAGYGLSTEVSGSSGETVDVNDIIDEEVYGHFDIVKYDWQTNTSAPQGDGDLNNVVYEVVYVGYNTNSIQTALNKISGSEPVEHRTWHLKTVYDSSRNAYVAKFDSAHLANGSPSTTFYTSGEGAAAEIVCPVGTYLVREIQHGTGYETTNHDDSRVAEGQPGAWYIYNFHVPDDEADTMDNPEYDMRIAAQRNGLEGEYNNITKFSDVVWHGDLELRKGDDEKLTFVGTDDPKNDADRQGEAHFQGSAFAIYNRSKYPVVSPYYNNKLVNPGEIVGILITDENGYASTKQWSLPASWPHRTANEGRLAYGQYEAIEILPPEGYMLNNDWHGMATNTSGTQYPTSTQFMHYIQGATASGLTNTLDSQYPDQWPDQGLNKAARPSSTTQWVNADDALVQFGTVGGNTLTNADKSSWITDSVIRGGVKIGKVDRENQQYKPQGKASLENHVLAVYSRNLHPIKVRELKQDFSGRPTVGAYVAPGWNSSETRPAATNTSMALGTQTKDGVLVAYINTKAVTENGVTKYIAETDKDTLPYGMYRIKEVYVPSNSGYLFDQISADWYEDFAIGSALTNSDDKYASGGKKLSLYPEYTDPIANFTKDATYHTTITQSNATKVSQKDTDARNPGQSNNYSYVDFTRDAKYCISNYVLRGDILIHKKVSDADSTVLKFVPFLVVSKTTGEAHIIVTDQNGDATSMINNQASQIGNDDTGEIPGYTLHTFMTNANDENGVLTKTNGIPVLAKDSTSSTGFKPLDELVRLNDKGLVVDSSNNTPNFQWSYGSWFHGRADTYTNYVRRAWQNSDNPTYGEGTPDNYITAGKGFTPTGLMKPDDSVGALPYDDYIIFELMVPEREVTDIVTHAKLTGDSNTDFILVGNGEFSVTTNNGEYVDKQNAVQRSGYTVISWNNPTAADIRNQRYPVKVDLDNQPKPSLGTTLVDEENNHMTKASGAIDLYDTVKYWNLVKGESYNMHGVLHKVAYDEQGNKIDGGVIAEADQPFIAQNSDASVIVTFEDIDASQLSGESVTAYEYLTDAAGQEVSKHEDITDTEQTVSFSDMGTTMTDYDGDKEVRAYEPIKLIDTVSYSGLIIDQDYTVTGTLHIKNPDGSDGGEAVDDNGNVITASTTFTAAKSKGTVDVVFEFNGVNLGGKTVVAFEKFITEDRVFMTHEDINDVAQTVYFPGIGTTALDGITGDHMGLADEAVTLYDVVEYKNLVKGKRYTLDGTLMDRETGQAFVENGSEVKGAKTFVAGYLDGSEESVRYISLDKALELTEEFLPEGTNMATLKTELAKIYTDPVILDTEADAYAADVVRICEITDESVKTKIAKAITDYFADPTASVDEVKEVVGKADPDMASADKAALESAFVTACGTDPKPLDEAAAEKAIDDTKTALGEDASKYNFNVIKSTVKKYYDELISTETVVSEGAADPDAVVTKVGDVELVSGTVRIPFEVSADTIRGKVTVVFEDLYMAPGQSDDITPEGAHEVEISKTDVATTGELPGATLIITKGGTTVASWVSENTPKTVKLDEGDYTLIEITAPEGYTQAESIKFSVDKDGLVEGDKVEMKDAAGNPKPVAIHEDINDDNQSVVYPDIRTLAHVDGMKDSVTASGEVHLTDVVSYTNLIPGREYVMNGVLMDKFTNEPAKTPEGDAIVAQTVFTPETASGTIEMEFVFNGRALEFHDTVVFENVYTAKSGVADELIHVGKHEDMDDADQTVGFGEDDLADELIEETGDHTLYIIVGALGVAVVAGLAFGLRRRMSR